MKEKIPHFDIEDRGEDLRPKTEEEIEKFDLYFESLPGDPRGLRVARDEIKKPEKKPANS